MTLLNILAALALLLVLFITIRSLRSGGKMREQIWIVPSIFCAALSAWTIFAVLQEGLFGFWAVHTQTLWGNQVWFDLLMALTMAWVLIVPRAKKRNMKLPLWLVFILCSGSIGFSAMLARLLYLENRRA